MNREETKDLLDRNELLKPIQQAFVEGKSVEVRDVSGNSDWYVTHCPGWDTTANEYRIKPEPKYRQFNLDELPLLVGYSVKNKETGDVCMVERFRKEIDAVVIGDTYITAGQLLAECILLVPTGVSSSVIHGLCQLEERPCGVLEE